METHSWVYDKTADLRLLALIRVKEQIASAAWESLTAESTRCHGATEDIVKVTHDLGQRSQEIVGSVRVRGSAFAPTSLAGGWSFSVSCKAMGCRAPECAQTDSYPTEAGGTSAPSQIPALFI